MQDQKNTNRKNSLLTEGDTILICDREFKIKELISDKGASAVCYKAECDFGVGTLKEFIPINLNFHRNSNNQVVFDEPKQEAEKMIDDYIKPHKILMDKRKDENIAVFIPVFEILYGCSDDGKQASVYLWTPEPPKQTFEDFCTEVHANTQKKPEENLFHILTAVLSLSKCLIYIHRAQLLHRDIKPSNFGFPMLGNDKLSNNISIFDINTVCSVFADEYDKVFSDGFTEPEKTRPTNQTDIYSVGATLFYALTGNLYNSNNYDEIEMNVDDSELMKVLTNTIHPKLKGKIISVLKKTLAPREKRYSNCESLSFDIEQALKCFSQSETGKNFDKNIYFALQHHIYTKPVYKYIPKDSDSINILIIGFGNFSQKYLDIILQTCQMPDKNLNVTVISDSAKKGKEAYLNERPKLKEFFNIDGSLPEDSDSYGNINFKMYRFSENTAENENFLKGIEKQYSSVFIAMGNDRFNAQTAKTIHKVFGKNCLVSAVAEQETIEENPSFVYVRSDFSKDPVSQDIERMAFNTHLIWEQSLNVDINEVRNEYRKPYNHDSNISFVLSMKYRLFSLGFDMDKMSVQEISRGYVKYLNDNKDAKNQLTYLEHARWNTEKALEGYNTLKNLSECIRLNGNKDKKKKLLTCLVKSRPEEKLSSWSKEEWDTKTKKELEAELDELDTMSVRLHQTFLRESKKNFDLHGGTAAEIFKSISKEPMCYSAFSELVSNMETVYNRQSSNQWKRYRSLKSAFIDAVNNSNLTQNQQEHIKKQTELLDSQFFPIIESRKYTDYKAFDIALVSGIPFILNYSTKDFYLTVPYILGQDKLFENLASATVINPTHIIYPLWITDKEQIQEIQKSLPLIEAYFKNKNLHARIEFFMGIADSCDADTDNLEETFKKQNSRISKVKTNVYSNEKLFVEFLKKYLTEKSKNKLNFIIQENETRLSGMINSELPSFSFNSVKMEFTNIYNCDIVNYIDKRSYLTTDDMTALRLSRSIPKNNPEFFEDYAELWDKYFNNTKEWKSLGNNLSDYSEKNDVLAVFGEDKKNPLPPNTYVWYIPLSCHDCISEILDMLSKENYIKSYKVTTISASLCKVEIIDRFGYKKEFDNIFRNINGLMLGQIKAVLYTKSHIVRVVYNNLYVKNFNYSKLNNTAVQLLKYFADKRYLIDFTIDGKKASFIYASYPIKELLTSEGRMLEIYTYHKVRETGFFDDIKSSLEIMWSQETAKNELDLVVTKGFCSLFIECKATWKLENNFYSKLNNIAAHFGVNTKMVLIGDTLEVPGSVTASDNEACRNYGKDFGIITISDRKEIENIGEVLVKVMKGEYK